MHLVCKILFLCASCNLANNAFAQSRFAQKVVVQAVPADSLAFTSGWGYHWYMIKQGDVTFENTNGTKLKAEDTAHLYFTSHCETNVQGGYAVQYCYASIKKGVIKLNFLDGMPTYSSQYNVFIKGDSFYCKAKTVYPISSVGEKIIDITKQQTLVLDKQKYEVGDTLKGYINFTFRETSRAPGRKTYNYTYYFKGFFCTLLGEKEVSGW